MYDRQRHVKCDETRPACIKCLSTRGACGGYHVKPRKNESWRHRLSRLTKAETIPKEPTAHIAFDTQLEHSYFEEWQSLAQGSLTGHMPTKLWTVFMPQLTFQNPSLRHAALSIGAVSSAMSSKCTGAAFFNNPHYHNAVSHYCRALHLMGRAKPEQTRLQDAMLISVLFAAFEGLRGNRPSLWQHVASGFWILKEVLGGPDGGSRMDSLAPDPGDLIREVMYLYMHLALQTQVVRNKIHREKLQLRSPTPSKNSPNPRLFSYLTSQTAPTTLPRTFSSPAEAADHLAAMKHQIHAEWPEVVALVQHVFRRGISTFADIDAGLDEYEKHPEFAAILCECHQMMKKWHASFEPLYRRMLAQPSIDRATYIHLISLRIEYLIFWMHVMFSQQGNYHAVSSLTDKCREVNELCKTILREQHKGARNLARTFGMNNSFLWKLIFVALKCRDPVVRDNAIRIMQTYPRRDGLLDSRAFLAVARKNRKVEHTNSLEGGTPEQQWRRLCPRVFFFEDSGATIVFRFTAKNPKTEEWELVEKYIDYDNFKPFDDENMVWRRRVPSNDRLILQWGLTTELRNEASFLGMGCAAPILDPE